LNPFSHTPAAFLYGYVQSLTPGYRSITIGGTTYTIGATTAAGSVFPDYVAALNTAISGAGWGASIAATGAVQLAGSSAAVAFPDSLGLLLGLPITPGSSAGTVTALQSSTPSLACLPLYGATWDEVDVRRSVEYEVTRMARTHGYVYGGARVYTWRLTMDRHALTALNKGWLTRSRLRIQGTATGATGTPTNAISSSNPSGYVDGYPLGIRSVRWLDGVQEVAEVTLMVTGGSA
jgi:hypothetical protein